MLPSQDRFRPLYQWSLCLVAFSVPFPFILGSLSVILLVLSWVLGGHYRGLVRTLSERKVLLLWAGFFVLHLISYTYSTDKRQAAFDLESKLSFLILPLVVGTIRLGSREVSRILGAFVWGVALSLFLAFGAAGYRYLQTGSPGHLFYHELVRGFDANAVYFSWYVLTALAALLYRRWEPDSLFSQRRIYWPLLLLLCTGLFFLSSRTFLVLFVILALAAPAVRTGFRFRLRASLVLAGIVTTAIVVLSLTSNPVRQRFQDVLAPSGQETKPGRSGHRQFTNLTLRLLIWETAWRNMEEQGLWLTGCGIGDVALAQKARMKDDPRISPYDFHQATIWKFNLHNMYLQSLYMLGIPGLLLFLCMITVPFVMIRYLKDRSFFYVFQITSLIFMIQESALQTQAGIIFFSFFSMVQTGASYTTVNSGSSGHRV